MVMIGDAVYWTMQYVRNNFTCVFVTMLLCCGMMMQCGGVPRMMHHLVSCDDDDDDDDAIACLWCAVARQCMRVHERVFMCSCIIACMCMIGDHCCCFIHMLCCTHDWNDCCALWHAGVRLLCMCGWLRRYGAEILTMMFLC